PDEHPGPHALPEPRREPVDRLVHGPEDEEHADHTDGDRHPDDGDAVGVGVAEQPEAGPGQQGGSGGDGHQPQGPQPRRPAAAARRPGLRAGRGVRRSGRGPDGRLHRRPPFGGAGAGAAARPPPPGITSGAGQDFGQLFSMSPSTPLSEPGPFWKYLTMPVQKLPDPTADGIWSEASNRAVPDARAVVSTVDGSPSCLLA